MSDAYVGQVMLVPFAYAPKNWAQCDGATLPISQYQAVFSLLGTVYGGNGVTTFLLPDLRSRTPLGMSGNYPIGNNGGMENVTLLSTQLPPHMHTAGNSTQSGTTRNPANAYYGNTGTNAIYAAAGTQVQLNQSTAAVAGQTQPHPNVQPYSVLNFCIALNGVYPTRS